MPQYVLEEVLRAIVAELPTVDLRLGWRVTKVGENATDTVDVQVCDPTGALSAIRTRFLVGADGARSVVRAEMGATYQGSTGLRPNTGVVFRSDELGAVDPHDPAVQTWVLNQQTPGMMGPIDRQGLWWLIAFGVDGTAPDLDVRRLVRGAIGQDLPVEVISTDPWTARMGARRSLSAGTGVPHRRRGPTSTHLSVVTGLNTGIGDAVDLGWKLAGCLEGVGRSRAARLLRGRTPSVTSPRHRRGGLEHGHPGAGAAER